jgi:uncharacterized small protein (DUF1192 family)
MTENKGAQFLSSRIGSDALTIAELVEQIALKDARIAALEAVLTEKQKAKLAKVS